MSDVTSRSKIVIGNRRSATAVEATPPPLPVRPARMRGGAASTQTEKPSGPVKMNDDATTAPPTPPRPAGPRIGVRRTAAKSANTPPPVPPKTSRMMAQQWIRDHPRKVNTPKEEASTPPPAPAPAEVPATLSDAQLKRLAKAKKDPFATLAQKVAGLPGTPRAEYNEVAQTAESNLGQNTVSGIDFMADLVTSTATNIAGFMADCAGMEIPFLSSITGAIKAGWDLAKAGVSLVKLFRESSTKTEAIEALKDGVSAILDMAGNVTDFLSDCGLFKEIPIVGAVIGTLCSCLDIAMATYTVVNQGINSHRMTKQRKALVTKSGRFAKATAGGEIDDEFRTGKKREMRTDDKNKATHVALMEKRAQLEHIANHEAASEDEKRDARAELAALIPMEEALAASMEDDAVSEIQHANSNRIRRGTVELLQGFSGVISSLATIDPSYGSAGGAALSGLTTMAGWGYRGSSRLRQFGRDHDWAGTDKNKSANQKKMRRHRLSVVIYNNVKEVGKLGLKELDPATVKTQTAVSNTDAGLNRFSTVRERVVAMDVGYGALLRAGTADEMVDTMRQGFYRESR